MPGIAEDLGDDLDAQGVDERMASGGQIPPGFYACKLNGAVNKVSKTNGTPGYELTFLVTSGPFEGTEVTDTLWRTDKQSSKDRVKLFAHRLGLLNKSADGKSYVPVEGKAEFVDVLDVTCVVEIIHEPDQNNPNKHWPRFAWAGVYKPDDPEAIAALANGGKRPEKSKDGKATPAPAAGNKSAPNAKPAPAPTPAKKRAASADL